VLLTRELRYLRPWLVGASVWLMVSLVVSLAHLRTAHPDNLFELSGLMCLLWLQFGFAGIFHTLRNEKGRNAFRLLAISLLPPLILFFINFVLLW
jgi:hypothetical protein